MEALPVFFIFAVKVGVASWVLAVAESIGALLLQPWAFRLGLRAIVIEEEAEWPSGLGTIATRETERLKYRVLGDNRCLFRRRYKLFEFRWNTPLEIKGTVAWKEGKLTTVGRYPFGSCFRSGLARGVDCRRNRDNHEGAAHRNPLHRPRMGLHCGYADSLALDRVEAVQRLCSGTENRPSVKSTRHRAHTYSLFRLFLLSAHCKPIHPLTY